MYSLAIRLAVPFVRKARLRVKGLKAWKQAANQKVSTLAQQSASSTTSRQWAWFHCASLGEFEQGRPVLEALKKAYPQYHILLTFFSASGFEIRKKYAHADHVMYLPADSPGNARQLLDIFQPALVFFIKYEIWVHYILEISRRKIPLFLVSTRLDTRSSFLNSPFKRLYRRAFRSFDMIFAQDDLTVKLLAAFLEKDQPAGFTDAGENVDTASTESSSVSTSDRPGNASLVPARPAILKTGDTRFDRVLRVKTQFDPVPEAAAFREDRFCIVCGSTWPADETLILKVLASIEDLDLCWIIAPHEIHPARIETAIQKSEGRQVAFSKWKADQHQGKQVLWIDNIGMLNRLYHYGDLAYVGGGFGKGIHNTLEAAVFGNPVFFGPNHTTFNEALKMTEMGTAFSVDQPEALEKILRELYADRQQLAQLRQQNAAFVESQGGATQKIVAALMSKDFLKN